MASVKLKAKSIDGGLIEVKALMTHPMETGLRKDSSGAVVPAHYITEVVVTANDKEVMKTSWGGSVSKNPYLSFNYKGAVGDKLKLTWKDNKDGTDTAEAAVE
ncbi:sulfur-oxidizing protein SoxZ [Thiothrix eikelboomii]|uniref:Sulfur-oxidizing protein SoxZ n=1 Tax=Thiothrix eikelboomii TaxID=92487 RepID=A0A1T4VU34_9GAMM|nr:thiosulfate oxidation carrier complex protein SoxZ [Thiothrix eikelboomii]SKA68510.1 sulfur-oxidizing protein SoxZ [Thiothrix eikelboomii]